MIRAVPRQTLSVRDFEEDPVLKRALAASVIQLNALHMDLFPHKVQPHTVQQIQPKVQYSPQKKHSESHDKSLLDVNTLTKQ